MGGLEPIAVELSGGQFLPPVQTLVATIIFCPNGQKMHIESSSRNQKRTPSRWMVFFFGYGSGTNLRPEGPGGERADRRRGRKQGGERVAAVGR